ncbi:outer membrane beta-barrel protein [Flavobacterium sp.]|uniref:outer membrane beta-barrel protein n=1 Tax=Flavobacterium sp. TaxID=239 RepID=UPI002617D524|nr:outer membrane beta-barrel protein [Flavobacterium sp.]
MIKKLVLALTLLFCSNFYAQIKFEKAYFIDNNNIKIECFIKNFDWKNNPTHFEFKKNETDGEITTKTVKEVKEFSIEEGNRYISQNIAVDTSSVDIRSYSNKVDPEWAQKQLFLKEIIAGDYSLYEYADSNMKLYFFKPKDGNIEQLIYKKYLINYNDVKENNTFRRQLLKAKPESITMERIAKINYNLKSITDYFLEINNIDGKNVVVRNSYTKNLKDKFLFNFKLGTNFSSLSLERNPQSSLNPDVSFENKNTIKVGFEVEYVFPFNKNKWAIYFEPTYQTKYQSETKVTRVTPGGWNYPPETWSASYNALDLNFGLRYYMFVSPKSKLFANLGYVFCPTINKELGNVTENEKYKIVPSSKFIIGLGYNYNKKYSLEARYGSTNILDDYGGTIQSKFKTFSFVFGYTIFETNKK